MHPSMAKHRFSLVACARWEEMQIQKWVEYHKPIGFDHADPFATCRHYGEQANIYLHFLDTFRQETEWFSFLRIDEFLGLKRVNNIAAFMRDDEAGIDCLYFNSLVYGNSNKIRSDDRRALTPACGARGLNAHTKMICRPA
jgi:hypothetical protein